jgi:hypothetical protein
MGSEQAVDPPVWSQTRTELGSEPQQYGNASGYGAGHMEEVGLNLPQSLNIELHASRKIVIALLA